MTLTRLFLPAALACAGLLLAPAHSLACTNILVTPGASADGSSIVTYAADSHVLYGELYHSPRATHPKGAMLRMTEWDTGRHIGEIPQVEQTYSTIGNMNEHQLIIGETTFGGRHELADSTGLIDYGSMIYIALQRAKTAREAIHVMTSLVADFGYCSEGESFSIADPKEIWILEMVGKGTRLKEGKNLDKGAVWVAVRLPDGTVSAHANQARIRKFDWKDKQNCLYSPDVASFARSKGWYSGPDADFSFAEAYCPLDFSAMRACEARVWSFFNKIDKPMMAQYLDFAMGQNPDNPMPLYITPSKKVDVKEVMDYMRDHYEETPMDMRNDIGAGGHNMPYRWRPMSFEVDGKTYINERAIATQQTGFWFVGQARKWLPDPVGGVLWFGVDDAGTSCLTPVYCGATAVPGCFAVGNGSMLEYSPTSAFWLFNRVSNFAYLRYDRISADVLKVVDEFENKSISMLKQADYTAAALYAESPEKCERFINDFTVNRARVMFDRWVELDRYLLVKYIDGNVKKEDTHGFKSSPDGYPAMPDQPGYNEKWKRAVVEDHGDVILQQ